MSEPNCIDYAKAMGDWPNCEIPDCPNKACLHLNSPRCWPHTVGQPFNCHDGMTDEEIEQFNAEVEYNFLANQQKLP